MDDTLSKMLKISLVLILAGLLTFTAVWVIAPELVEPVFAPGDGNDQVDRVDQIEPDMSVTDINNLLNLMGEDLTDIERKMEYIDPDDHRNLSVLGDELKNVTIELRNSDGAIAGLNNTSITESTEDINNRVNIIQRQIDGDKKNYYADILAYGLKGVVSGAVLCILVVALPYLQYRRGKLYGLIGHGGEGEYARDRFIRFLYVMMAFGFVILVIGLISVMVRIVLI